MQVCKTCHVEKGTHFFNRKGLGLQESCKSCVANLSNECKASTPLPEKCKSCEKSSPAVEFQWRFENGKGTWRPECIECTVSKRNMAKAKKSTPDGTSQKCDTCNVIKDATCFNITGNGSLRKKCKECRKTQSKQLLAATKDLNILNKSKQDHPTHACEGCNRSYPDVSFKWRDDVAQGGWRKKCLDCINAKEYYVKHRKEWKKMQTGIASITPKCTSNGLMPIQKKSSNNKN